MKNLKKTFWGIAIILVAVLIILSNIPTFTVFTIFSLWDIVLLVILTAILIKSLVDREFFGIFVPIGIAYYIVTKDLAAKEMLPTYLPQMSLWLTIVIIAFLSTGFSILFKKPRNVNVTFNSNNKNTVIDGKCSTHESGSEGVVNISNNMGSMTRYIDCNDFRELNIDNNFGQVSAYLSNCTLASAQCKVNLDNNFGNINVYVPKEWQVVLNPGSSFGKVDFHKSCEAPAGAPIAYINADSSFGSIEIYQL